MREQSPELSDTNRTSHSDAVNSNEMRPNGKVYIRDGGYKTETSAGIHKTGIREGDHEIGIRDGGHKTGIRDKTVVNHKAVIKTGNTTEAKDKVTADKRDVDQPVKIISRTRQQSPWACSILTAATSIVAITLLITIVYSFLHLQREPKGCQMSYMRPMFERFSDFDTEHSRFASKYSLYLYREYGVDEDTRVKGVPVVFIPGNAGSYKQVRPIAAEAATFYQEYLQDATDKQPLDFFSVDFNEDITAFHGQTLLDQAEYLNEAVAFILALYHNPARSQRHADLPEPRSVIIIGHSMGGMVARTMLTMPNYQERSINTIVTLSAPHARPPVSFDAGMVALYHRVNTYWRQSLETSLSDVSIISVAGGGLDTMIPSEYTSLTSLVPESHGFTVFTSGIPNVWTSMDHLAIMWCDQLRKALIRSIFDVIHVKDRSQTLPLTQRMTAFRNRLLTGLDHATIGQAEDHLLRIDDLTPETRLSISSVGNVTQTTAHLLALKPDSIFSLMTDRLNPTVLLCKESSSSKHYDHIMDLSHGTPKLFGCKKVSNTVLLPASTFQSKNSFDETTPFSYIQLDAAALASYQFIAVIEEPADTPQGFVLAEIAPADKTSMTINKGHHEILLSGLQIEPPQSRPMMIEMRIPEVHSTLFAYNLEITQSPCVGLFSPLLRQHIAEPYESKYFVNTAGGSINVHGVSPYMPPALSGGTKGLSLQLWTDPTCDSTIKINLKLDRLGSAGKLVMRYRTVVAVLPLLVILIVVRKQFKVYDSTGVFISFSASMDQCIRTSVPFVFLALTFLSLSLSKAAQGSWTYAWLEIKLDFEANDLMLGTQDPFLWFLVPLFGIISIGVCICANYILITVMSILSVVYGWTRLVPITFTYQRIVTILILLLLITTLVPYQFGYAVLTMVQLARTVRNLHIAKTTETIAAYNFFNYSHSISMMLLWVLPINIPVLIVWVHNLASYWLTPFSTHHNLLTIAPLIVCVELISTGHMIPQTKSWMRHVTNTLLFVFALYAAVFGVSYAYRLHHLLNGVAAWLVLIYLTQEKVQTQQNDVPLSTRNNISDGSFLQDQHKSEKRSLAPISMAAG